MRKVNEYISRFVLFTVLFSVLFFFEGKSTEAVEIQAIRNIVATGGTINEYVGNGTNGTLGVTYRTHTFTNVGNSTFNVTAAPDNAAVEVLVVGGGGGGGGSAADGWNAGGGGGGGVIYNQGYSITTGSIAVSVGNGGNYGTPSATNNGSTTTVGSNGSNSVFGTLTAIGGGGGGASSGYTGGQGTKNNGLSGGSGGGAGSSYASTYSNGGTSTSGQGTNGGTSSITGSGFGGGGGGAGSVGTGPISSGSGGGAGLPFSISGTSVTYASGGGTGTATPSNAVANSGNGGNGAYAPPNTAVNSGAGGSGIVIVRYTLDTTNNTQPIQNIEATGGIVSDYVADGTNGTAGVTYRTHKFTTVGSSTFTVTSAPANASVEALVVAGGGGGGSFGGGGGAGGVIQTNIQITSQAYTVTVGDGGNGATITDTGVNGINGANSIFNTLTAVGGGGGGSRFGSPTYNGNSGNLGGSGGGGANSDSTGGGAGGGATSGQGYTGGSGGTGTTGTPNYSHGGGGGAGGIGQTGKTNGSIGANGGIGISNSISGTPTFYAGGGGGGVYTTGTKGIGGNGGGGNGGGNYSGVIVATAGTSNTGGGGGGGAYSSPGGKGGSGIVIIRYTLDSTDFDLQVTKSNYSCGADANCATTNDNNDYIVKENETINYTVGYQNAGTTSTSGVYLTDLIPNGTCYVVGSLEANLPADTSVLYSNDSVPTFPTGGLKITPTADVNGVDCNITAYKLTLLSTLQPATRTYLEDALNQFTGTVNNTLITKDGSLKLKIPATFSQSTISAGNTGFTSGTEIIDIDKDNDLDIVAAGNNSPSFVYTQTSANTFSSTQISAGNTNFIGGAVISDIDADNDWDIIMGGDNYPTYVFFQGPTGTFTQTQISAGNTNFRGKVKIIDVDNDGRLDVVGGGYTAVSKVFYRNANNTFTESNVSATVANFRDGLEVVDIDKDGDKDLVGGGYFGKTYLYKQTSARTFQEIALSASDTNFLGGVVIVDINNDANTLPDIIGGGFFGDSFVYKQSDTNVFSEVALPGGATRFYSKPVLLDIETDGDKDIVAGGYGRPTYLYTQDVSGNFQRTQLSNDNTYFYSGLKAVDIEGDGDTDVIGVGFNSHSFLYKNNDDGSFTESQITSVIANFIGNLEVTDINGDSHLDVVGGSDAGKSYFLINDGFLNFTQSELSATNTYFKGGIKIADIDNDGDNDIVGGGDGGPTYLYSNTSQYVGSGSYTTIINPSVNVTAWNTLTFTKSSPTNTTISYQVKDVSGANCGTGQLIPQTTVLDNTIDLTGINASNDAICLIISLTTSNFAVSPQVNSISVNYNLDSNKTFTYKTKVEDTANDQGIGLITGTANLYPKTNDENQATNTAQSNITLNKPGEANLFIQKSSFSCGADNDCSTTLDNDSAKLKENEIINYIVKIQNQGDSPAEKTSIIEAIPDRTCYVLNSLESLIPATFPSYKIYYSNDDKITWTYVPTGTTIDCNVSNIKLEVTNVYRTNGEFEDFTDLNNSLAGHWSFDEGTGLTTEDKSGNGNEGTLTGGATWTTGIFGNSISYDGTDDYVKVRTTSALKNIREEITISAWIYGDAAGQPRDNSFLYAYDPSGKRALNMHSPWSDGNMYFDGGNDLTSSYDRIVKLANPSDYEGQWNHWVYTKNTVTGVMNMYLNGALWHTGSGMTKKIYINELRIGGYGGRYYMGKIDELRIYSKELNASEIKSLYKQTNQASSTNVAKTNNNLTKGLSGHWKFDEIAGTSALDSSGNNITGTLTGGPVWTLGKKDNSIKFDGTDDYINFSANPSASHIFTTSFWFKTPTPSANKYLLDRGGNIHWFELLSSKLRSGTSASNYSDSTTTIQANTWYFATMTYDGTTVKQYINGMLQFSIPGGNVTPLGLQIGRYYNNSYYFNGQIDDIRIYSRPLSAQETYNLYLDGTEKFTYNDNLVGYWKMDEASWSATAGDVKDTSGFSFNGTGLGGVTTGAGKLGNGGIFDGTDDYITVPNNETLKPTKAITLSHWVKYSGFGDRWEISNSPSTFSYNNGFSLREDSPTNKAGLFIGHGATYSSLWSTTTLNTGTWYLVTGVFDGAFLKIYINGVLDGTVAASGSMIDYTGVASSLYISQRADNALRHYGSLDEVRIYNKALTDDEIKDLYIYSPNPIKSPGPVAEWKFDETTGNIAYDSTGNNNISSTFIGGTTRTLGKYNSALYFDGSDDYVPIPETTLTDLGTTTDSITVSAWVNTKANFAAQGTIVAKDDGSGAYPFVLYISSLGYACFKGFDTTNSSNTCSTFTVNDGTWHYITGTRDVPTDKYYIYVDGVLANSSTDITTLTMQNNDNWVIGNGGNSYVQFDFLGLIDEVKIYNYTRSQSQTVEDMFNSNNKLLNRQYDGQLTLNNNLFKTDFSNAGFNMGTNDSNANHSTPILVAEGKNNIFAVKNQATFDGFDDYLSGGSSSISGSVDVEAKVNPVSVIPARADWFDSAWKYRKSVTISNSSGSELTNQMVKFTIDTAALYSAGKIQINCNDIRVTDAFGYLLNHWDTTCNSASTDVYVKLSSLPSAGKTLHVYYGNPAAQNIETTLGTTGNPGTSCKMMKSQGSVSTNGTYFITPGGNGADKIQVYCDVTTLSEGWTVVINSNRNVATNPEPVWNDAINSINTTGTFGTDLNAFDLILGLKHWNYIGSTALLQIGSNASTITKRATYSSISLNTSNFYSLSLGTETIQLGGTSSGFKTYHAANNFKFTTSDADNDAWSGNCANNYGGSPWWYGGCWDGNFWGGGDSGGYQNAPFWSGSTADYNDHGSIMLGGADTMKNVTAGALGTEVPNPSPVGYWNFDDASGTVAQDNSGTGNTGIWNGTLGNQWVTGKFNTGGSFDGTTNFVEATTTSSLSVTSAFTFETWIYQTANCTTDCIIFNKENDYEWRVVNGVVDYAIGNTAPGWAWITTGITINKNEWTHLALTYDSNTQYIYGYKNGVQLYNRPSSTGSLRNSNLALRLAARNAPNAGSSFFGGKLDEVRIYNYARTPAQIYEDMSNSKAAVTGGTVLSKGENYELSLNANSAPTWTSPYVTRSGFSTNAITSKLNGIAVNDVFYYDTTLDTDYGTDKTTDPLVWRFDTTKSWYTETIDAPYSTCNNVTHDRCGTREFPEKVYIVATATRVYIFDAKENTMWMRFDTGVGGPWANQVILTVDGAAPKSLFMLNGKMYVGNNGNNGSYGLHVINFINDTGKKYSLNDYSSTYNGNISTRNNYASYGWGGAGTGVTIVNSVVNDISGAVINGKTYFAVATVGGVSVVNETDNTKVNIVPNNNPTYTSESVDKLWLTTKGELYVVSHQHASAYYGVSVFYTLPTGNISADYFCFNGQTNHISYDWQGSIVSGTGCTLLGNWKSSDSATMYNDIYVSENTSSLNSTSNTIYLSTSNAGVIVINEKQGDESNGSVKYITKDFTSEEMVGDIRGMWPFYGTGNIANNTYNVDDVSYKSSELTAKNTNGTGLSYVDGVKGKAISFDGVDDYLCTDTNDDGTCDDNDSLDATTAFSQGAWIKTTSTSTDELVILSKFNGGVAGAHVLYLYQSIPRGHVEISPYTAQATTAVNDGKWHHIAHTYDGSTAKIYVDGILEGTRTISGSIPNRTVPFMVGARLQASTPSYYFPGTIDDPFVTAETLTASQIKNMYEIGRKALEEGLTKTNGTGSATSLSTEVTASGLRRMGTSNYTASTLLFSMGTTGDTLYEFDLGSDSIISTVATGGNVTEIVPTTGGKNITSTSAGLRRVNDVSSKNNILPNKDTNVRGIFDQVDGYYKLYEDGNEVGRTFVGTGHAPAGNNEMFAIGGKSSGAFPGNLYSGTIKSVEVWKTDLTGSIEKIITPADDFNVWQNLLLESNMPSGTDIKYTVYGYNSGCNHSNILYGPATLGGITNIAGIPSSNNVVCLKADLSTTNYKVTPSIDSYEMTYGSDTKNQFEFRVKADVNGNQSNPIANWKFDEGSGFLATNSNWTSTGTMTNLVTNPSIETATTGWANYAGGAVAQSTTASFKGTYSLKYTADATYNPPRAMYHTYPNSITINPSTVYTIAVWVKRGQGTTLPLLNIKTTVNGGEGGGRSFSINGLDTNEWQRIYYSITTTATENGFLVAPGMNGTVTAGDFIYIDSLQIETGASANLYCDGSITGNGTYIWNGTPHASTSTCDTGSDAELYGPIWMEGKYSKALSFDGVNDYAAFSDAGFPDSNNQFTVSLWVKSNSFTGGLWQTPFSYGTTTANQGLIIAQDGTNNDGTLSIGKYGSNVLDSIKPLSLTNWSHVVLTYNGTTLSLYLNGTLDNSANVAMEIVRGSGRIGSLIGGGQWFNGLIDDVRVFNRAITAGEISNLYSLKKIVNNIDISSSTTDPVLENNTSENILPFDIPAPDLDTVKEGYSCGIDNVATTSAGLAGYWKLDEGVGTTTKDFSGFGNNGVITNGTWATGKIGQALSFTGTGYINIGTGLSLNAPNRITIDAWIKPASFADYNSIAYSPSNTGWWLQTLTAGDVGAGRIRFGAGNAYVNSTTAIPLNAWSHIAGVFDGTSHKIYINGILDATGGGTATINDTGNKYLAAYSTTSQRVNGSVDQIRIFSRALSANEILNLSKTDGTAATGLINHWQLNEGTGTTTTDASGNGNTGTLTSGPAWVDGKFSKAVSFDGVDDYVTGPVTNLPLGSSARTISAWFKTSSSPKTHNTIFAYGTAAGGKPIYLITMRADGRLYTETGSGSDQIYSLTSKNDNIWHNVVLSYNGTVLKMYVDGVLQGSATTTLASASSAFQIGNMPWDANYKYTGLIDDVRMYNYALNDTEVKYLYSPDNCSLTDGLIGNWKLDSASINDGTETQDFSTNAKHGTVVNGPTFATGKIKNAVSFDGVDDYINLNTNFSQSNNITISMWFKTTSTSVVLFGQTNTAPTSAATGFVPALSITSSGYLRGELYSGNNIGITSSNIVNDNNWHNAILVGNTSTQKLYLDGILVGSKDGTISQSWWTVSTLGTGYDSGDRNLGSGVGWKYMNGVLDDVRVYNRAVSAEEARFLSQTVRPSETVKYTVNVNNLNTVDPKEIEITDLIPLGTCYTVGSIENTLSPYTMPLYSTDDVPTFPTTPAYTPVADTNGVDCNVTAFKIVNVNNTSGLVGYWDMNETSWNGTTGEVKDTSGSNNNGTAGSGASVSVSGKYGNAGAFDGIDDYLNIPDNNSLDPINISVAAWVKLNSITNYPTIVSKAAASTWTSPYGTYTLRANSSNSKWEFWANGYGSPVTSSNLITTGIWTYLVGTYDGTNQRIYINGSLEGTIARTGNITNSPYNLAIGSHGTLTNAGEFFPGLIDEVRIYNRALSAYEVKAFYNSPAAYWDFNENSGTVATDKTENGKALILYNGPTWTPGKTGSALSFNGTTQYVRRTGDASFNKVNGQELTVSAWINPSRLGGQYQQIVANRSASLHNWMLYQHTTNGTVQLHGSAQYASSYIPPINKWTHIAATVDATGFYRLYANGVLVQGPIAYTYQASAPSEISIGNFGTLEYYQGKVDEVQLFHRALSAQEINRIYLGNINTVDFKVKANSELPNISQLINTATSNVKSTGEQVEIITTNNSSTNTLDIRYPVAISGRVWNDRNYNGVQDTNEAGINGRILKIYVDNNADGIADGAAITSVTSVADAAFGKGYYLFENLSVANKYLIGLDPADTTTITLKGTGLYNLNSDFNPTTKLTDTITLSQSTVVNKIDLGLVGNMNIGGSIWEDSDDSGNIDNEDLSRHGMDQILVELYEDSNLDGTFDASDTLFASSVSDSNGGYNFTNLLQGKYIVVIPASEFDDDKPLHMCKSSEGNYPTVEDYGRYVGTNIISGQINLTSGVAPDNSGLGYANINFGFQIGETPIPWITGFTYRAPITITNPGGTVLSDFQVPFTLNTSSLITASKMQADCDDIRVTDSTMTTEIPYWVEEGSPGCNNAATRIWTKLSSIPTNGTTIYIYYGKADAVNAQSGTNVFEFFDDFNGSSLDTQKWSVPSGVVTVSSGEASISASIKSNLTWPRGYGTIARVKGQSSGYWKHIIELANFGTPIFRLFEFVRGQNGSGDSAFRANYYTSVNTSSTPLGTDLATFHVFEINRSLSVVTYLIDGSQVHNVSTTEDVNTFLSSRNDSSSSPVIWDWIAIKKIATTDPGATLGTETSIPSNGGGEGGSGGSASWLTNWAYRVPITIQNSGGTTLTDFQVPATLNTASLITASKLQGDCDDIRVTDSTGTFLLPHWIEENSAGCNNAATKIWTKLSSIPTTGTTIYVYYSNVSATNTENGDNVFMLFDNFNDGSINTSKWTQYSCGAGSSTETGGYVELAGTPTNGRPFVKSLNQISDKNIIIDSRAQAVGSMSQIKLIMHWDGTGYGGYCEPENSFNTEDWPQFSYYRMFKTVSSAATMLASGSVTDTNWHNYSFTYNNQNISLSRDGANVLSATDAQNFTTTHVGMGAREGYGNTRFDSFRVRKSTTTMPTIGAAGTEEIEVTPSPSPSATPTPSPTPDIASGLVAYWPFNEGTGTSTDDASVNSNSGTLTNGPIWINGKFGNGTNYDGTDDYTNLGDVLDMDSTDTMTMSAWLKTTNTTKDYMGLVSKWDADAGCWNGNKQSYSMHVRGNGVVNAVVNSDSGDDNVLAGTRVINDGNWHLITVTIADGSNNYKIYVDGTLDIQATKAGTGIFNSVTPLRIGLLDPDCGGLTNRVFAGAVDDVRIYNRALSSTEVTSLYTWVPGPIAHWKFDETSGTSASDSSNNGFTGTLTNGPTWVTGKYNNGVNFDGTDDYITMGTLNNLGFIGDKAYTIMLWAKPAALRFDGSFISYGYGGASKVMSMNSNGSNIYSVHWGNDYSFPTAWQLNNWQHVAITYDPTTNSEKLYVNGVYTNQSWSPIDLNISAGEPLYIGKASWNGTYVNSTVIDDVRIYNYVRTLPQITNDMNNL